ncbi:MAG TPA: MBL fold metallo-hydrolase [Armatimonadota bacterium]|nr:MBL fold metallo-hydrolase [Armatimonadota bacterium]
MDPNMKTNTRETAVSRRRFLAGAGLTAVATWLGSRGLLAQSDADGGVVGQMRAEAATARITVEALRGNVSVLMGSGGNIAVSTGRDGKLLVDAGMIASRPRITEALAAISAAPVKRVINTHWHFDHTDGNEWLHGSGATILAHVNTRKRLSTATRVEGWGFTFPPSLAGALPTEVFEKGRRLRFNGAAIELTHYGPAHTDTDITVHFADSDILHLGDLWWNGHYPFIDYSTGGSINGTIRAVEATLARVTGKMLVIPGHGPVGGKRELTEFRDMLRTTRDAVAALKKQGKSLAETVAARPTAAHDAKWGGFLIKGDAFTGLVYAGV